MKPLDGTFAYNAEKHGVAGLNIDGGRVGTEDNLNGGAYSGETGKRKATSYAIGQSAGKYQQPQGRWPANLILDEEAGKMLDEQTGILKSGDLLPGHKRGDGPNVPYGGGGIIQKSYGGDSGGASRFFYCAKTSRKERNMGMEDQKNNHPTVKPLALIKYLCTLLKMPGQNQIILDPFMGSGTTGMACKELGINYIGIEKEQEYCDISIKRIAAITHPGDQDAKK